MSLQDDVWDVEHALMGTAAAKSYARIVKRLWAQEQHNDELVDQNAEIAKLKELAQFQQKKLSQCASAIYRHHPELYDEIRSELKIDGFKSEIAKLKDTNKHLRDTVATYHYNNLKDALLMAEIDPAYREALRPYFEELARIFEVAK